MSKKQKRHLSLDALVPDPKREGFILKNTDQKLVSKHRNERVWQSD